MLKPTISAIDNATVRMVATDSIRHDGAAFRVLSRRASSPRPRNTRPLPPPCPCTQRATAAPPAPPHPPSRRSADVLRSHRERTAPQRRAACPLALSAAQRIRSRGTRRVSATPPALLLAAARRGPQLGTRGPQLGTRGPPKASGVLRARVDRAYPCQTGQTGQTGPIPRRAQPSQPPSKHPCPHPPGPVRAPARPLGTAGPGAMVQRRAGAGRAVRPGPGGLSPSPADPSPGQHRPPSPCTPGLVSRRAPGPAEGPAIVRRSPPQPDPPPPSPPPRLATPASSSDPSTPPTRCLRLLRRYSLRRRRRRGGVGVPRRPCSIPPRSTPLTPSPRTASPLRRRGPGPHNFFLHVRDCWAGLWRAKSFRWVDFTPGAFDRDAY
jgi:hypothetical protein